MRLRRMVDMGQRAWFEAYQWISIAMDMAFPIYRDFSVMIHLETLDKRQREKASKCL